MWKAFARDVLAMLSAVIVALAIAASLWFAVTLWLVPPETLDPLWVLVPFLAPAAVAAAGLGVLFYAPLRGRARLGQPIRPPYWRDTLVAPLAAGAALGLGLAFVAVVAGKKDDSMQALVAGAGLAALLVVAAWLVVLVQRWSAQPARALVRTAAVLVLVWLASRVLLDAWGGRIFKAYKSAALVEIAQERQLIAAERRPVLFGTPIDDNSADRYVKLTQAITGKLDKTQARTAIGAAVKDGPGRPLPPEALQWVAACRPELLALREAVRCTRRDWHFRWEQGFDAPLPSLLGARQAAGLLIIEGLAHAQQGDARDAIERSLEVIRMGSDYETSGGLSGTLIAIALEREGTEALLRLVSTGDLPSTPAWDDVESKLDLLEPHLASARVGYRGERLAYVGWERMTNDDLQLMGGPNPPSWLVFFFPGRYFVADCVRVQSDVLREAEKAGELTDRREAARLHEAAFARARRSRNFLVHMGLPSLASARAAQDRETARLRMLRAAIRLEKLRREQGRYPEDPTAVDLPVDPFAFAAKLRYASLDQGRGYKLWSVGANGTDEGGSANDKADEVFERLPRNVPETVLGSGRH